jgi:hypothetical protein
VSSASSIRFCGCRALVVCWIVHGRADGEVRLAPPLAEVHVQPEVPVPLRVVTTAARQRRNTR